MLRFAVVIEEGPDNYSAYSPDLPGCVTTGQTVDEVKRNMREAISGYLQSMRDAGEPIPEPTAVEAYCESVEVAS